VVFTADTLSGVVPFTVQFHDQTRGGRTSWQWDFGDGEKSTEQNPIHVYTTADTFTVSLTVTGPNGSDTKTKQDYIIVQASSAVDELVNSAPELFALFQNYPNPFNPSTMIQYAVKNPCRVMLRLYNTKGQELNTLVDRFQNSGIYKVNINLQDLPTGMYFYRIDMGGFHDVKKMVKIE
jgi:hypothetical protein